MALANQQAKRDVIVSKDALLKSYKKRLKVRILKVLNLIRFINNYLQDDVKGMADNFSEIVKLCRVEDENQVSEGLTFTLRPRITDWSFIIQVNRATQAEEDNLEMQVRASNMVRAGESLMKLVSDLKIYLILNDFPNVNEAISSNSRMFKDMQVKIGDNI